MQKCLWYTTKWKWKRTEERFHAGDRGWKSSFCSYHIHQWIVYPVTQRLIRTGYLHSLKFLINCKGKNSNFTLETLGGHYLNWVIRGNTAIAGTNWYNVPLYVKHCEGHVICTVNSCQECITSNKPGGSIRQIQTEENSTKQLIYTLKKRPRNLFQNKGD